MTTSQAAPGETLFSAGRPLSDVQTDTQFRMNYKSCVYGPLPVIRAFGRPVAAVRFLATPQMAHQNPFKSYQVAVLRVFASVPPALRLLAHQFFGTNLESGCLLSTPPRCAPHGSGLLCTSTRSNSCGCLETTRCVVSAVTQTQPLKVEIKGFKTSHFLEPKTAPRNSPDAGPMGHVELPKSEPPMRLNLPCQCIRGLPWQCKHFGTYTNSDSQSCIGLLLKTGLRADKTKRGDARIKSLWSDPKKQKSLTPPTISRHLPPHHVCAFKAELWLQAEKLVQCFSHSTRNFSHLFRSYRVSRFRT
jgi:hypothetical protein